MTGSGSLDPYSAHQDYSSSSHLWLLAQNIVRRTRPRFEPRTENPTRVVHLPRTLDLSTVAGEGRE